MKVWEYFLVEEEAVGMQLKCMVRVWGTGT